MGLLLIIPSHVFYPDEVVLFLVNERHVETDLGHDFPLEPREDLIGVLIPQVWIGCKVEIGIPLPIGNIVKARVLVEEESLGGLVPLRLSFDPVGCNLAVVATVAALGDGPGRFIEPDRDAQARGEVVECDQGS